LKTNCWWIIRSNGKQTIYESTKAIEKQTVEEATEAIEKQTVEESTE
jgi:Zn-finger protein